MTELLASVGPVTSATDYASALKLHVPPQTSKMMVHIKEDNVNAIKWTILGSIDDVFYSEEMAEASILKDGFDVHEITKAWCYIDVIIKSTVKDVHGKALIAVSGG